MKIIQLTEENIEQYLNECVELQKHLVTSEDSIKEQRFIDTATDTHGYFLGILSDEERLIGMGLVSKVVDPVRIIAYINNIVVHPDTRGQGLFGVIMDALEEKAKAWGCTRVELTCSRQAVQNLYSKRGYTHKDTHFYYLDIA